MDGKDIAADADAVPVDVGRQGYHLLAVIMAISREFTGTTGCDHT